MDCGIKRKNTKKVMVGEVGIGGDSPVTVQSMTNTDTRDIKATVAQIKSLEQAGCDIVRVAVPDNEAADAIISIKKAISIPLVADIHFDYRLALASMKNGADKIRINPGNIGDKERVKKIVDMAKERGIPIRIGVNSGSVEKQIIKKYNGVTAQGMVESALNHISMLEDFNFDDIVISIKASDVSTTIAVYRLISQRSSYPLHIGVTEAGTVFGGTVKSCVGIGSLLVEGIGDTLRVSLTGDPVEEVRVGNEILKSLHMKRDGIEFVSCPTCGRCQIDLVSIANEAEARLKFINKNLKVAVMGCAVNGPGEAREADIGIAGGKREGLLFKKGKVIRKIPQDRIVDELVMEIQKLEDS